MSGCFVTSDMRKLMPSSRSSPSECSRPLQDTGQNWIWRILKSFSAWLRLHQSQHCSRRFRSRLARQSISLARSRLRYRYRFKRRRRLRQSSPAYENRRHPLKKVGRIGSSIGTLTMSESFSEFIRKERLWGKIPLSHSITTLSWKKALKGWAYPLVTTWENNLPTTTQRTFRSEEATMPLRY